MHLVDSQPSGPSEAYIQSADPRFNLYVLNAVLLSPKAMVTVSACEQPVDFEVNSEAVCVLLGENAFQARCR